MIIQKRSLGEAGNATISSAFLLVAIFLTAQFAITEIQSGTNANFSTIACAMGVGSIGGTGPDGTPDIWSCSNGGGFDGGTGDSGPPPG